MSPRTPHSISVFLSHTPSLLTPTPLPSRSWLQLSTTSRPTTPPSRARNYRGHTAPPPTSSESRVSDHRVAWHPTLHLLHLPSARHIFHPSCLGMRMCWDHCTGAALDAHADGRLERWQRLVWGGGGAGTFLETTTTLGSDPASLSPPLHYRSRSPGHL